jgi:hypothetical protein
MEEVFPVAAGVLLGLLSFRLPRSLKAAVIGALSVVVGVLAAWLSGELAISWVYALVDTAQVAVAAVMTVFAVKAWHRYRARAVVR